MRFDTHKGKGKPQPVAGRFSTSVMGRLHSMATANPAPASSRSTRTTLPLPNSRMGWRNRGSSTAIVKLTRVRIGTGALTLKSRPPMLMFLLVPASSRTAPPEGKLSATGNSRSNRRCLRCFQSGASKSWEECINDSVEIVAIHCAEPTSRRDCYGAGITA